MKAIFSFFLVVVMAIGVKAQDSPQQLYLLFEFMQVKNEAGSDYYQVEQFWSGIETWLIINPLRGPTYSFTYI